MGNGPFPAVGSFLSHVMMSCYEILLLIFPKSITVIILSESRGLPLSVIFLGSVDGRDEVKQLTDWWGTIGNPCAQCLWHKRCVFQQLTVGPHIRIPG